MFSAQATGSHDPDGVVVVGCPVVVVGVAVVVVGGATGRQTLRPPSKSQIPEQHCSGTEHRVKLSWHGVDGVVVVG